MKTAAKVFVTVAVVAAALSFSSIQASAIIDGEGMLPNGRHLEKMATELGLTVQQQDAIKGVFAKNHPTAGPLMKQLKSERQALRALIQADAVDETAIRAQAAKIGTLGADMAVQRAKLGQEIRAILTPEQILKFKALQAKRESQGGMGPMRGGKKHPRQDS